MQRGPSPDDATVAPAGSDDQEFSALVRQGIGWSFLNNGVTRAGSLVVGIVMARILGPEEFGVFTVALIASLFLLSLNDIGLSQVIVRFPGNLDRAGPTATTLIALGSFVLGALAFLGAPLFTEALRTPEATGVVRLIAIGIVTDGLFSVPAALMTRAMWQRQRAVADVAGFVVTSSLSIGLALSGIGAASLAWGRLAGNLVVGVLILFLAPKVYRPGFDREVARELLTFGTPLAGSTLLNTALLNVDYVIVGRTLGATQLGYYQQAFNLSSWPINTISFSIRRISLAGFARLQHHRERLRDLFTDAMGLSMWVALPACALLITFAEPLIRFLYGEEWLPAVEPLRWLAVLGAVRVALDLAWDLLVAAGRPRPLLWLHGFWFLALIPAIWIGAEADGVRGAAIAHVLVAVVLVTPLYLWVVSASGMTVRGLGRAVVRPLLGTVGLVLVALGALALLSGDFVELAVGGAASLAVFVVLTLPMRHVFARLRDFDVTARESGFDA